MDREKVQDTNFKLYALIANLDINMQNTISMYKADIITTTEVLEEHEKYLINRASLEQELGQKVTVKEVENYIDELLESNEQER